MKAAQEEAVSVALPRRRKRCNKQKLVDDSRRVVIEPQIDGIEICWARRTINYYRGGTTIVQF